MVHVSDPLPALIAFLKSTGFINVTCQQEYSPPIVFIALPLGLGISIDYDLYEQIREDTGLPDDVCKGNEG